MAAIPKTARARPDPASAPHPWRRRRHHGHDQPDGRSAYEVGYGEPPVLSVFSRNTNTGVLTSSRARRAACRETAGARTVRIPVLTRVTWTPARQIDHDLLGRPVRLRCLTVRDEIGDDAVGGVAVFSRNLSPGRSTSRRLAGCVTSDGSSNEGFDTCAVGREVDDISNVHSSPDQKFLYASNYDSQPYSGIAIFSRNEKTGALTQLKGKEGCITSSGDTEEARRPRSAGRCRTSATPRTSPQPGTLSCMSPTATTTSCRHSGATLRAGQAAHRYRRVRERHRQQPARNRHLRGRAWPVRR